MSLPLLCSKSLLKTILNLNYKCVVYIVNDSLYPFTTLYSFQLSIIPFRPFSLPQKNNQTAIVWLFFYVTSYPSLLFFPLKRIGMVIERILSIIRAALTSSRSPFPEYAKCSSNPS
jgi:hypothetical protein